jgi:RNA polymerase sigma-70 factor (ECF subfamily)
VKFVSDKEILDLLEDDPSEGLRELIETYSSFVYTIVYSKLRSVLAADDIEEMVSFVFSRVYEKRTDIDLKRGSLKGYLSTLAKRMSIDEYRRHIARVSMVEMTDEIAAVTADATDMQENVERRLAQQALVDALKRLEQTDRDMLVRRYYYNQKSAEIARTMHMSDAAVRKRLSRAVDKLRTILLSQGGMDI